MKRRDLLKSTGGGLSLGLIGLPIYDYLFQGSTEKEVEIKNQKVNGEQKIIQSVTIERDRGIIDSTVMILYITKYAQITGSYRVKLYGEKGRLDFRSTDSSQTLRMREGPLHDWGANKELSIVVYPRGNTEIEEIVTIDTKQLNGRNM